MLDIKPQNLSTESRVGDTAFLSLDSLPSMSGYLHPETTPPFDHSSPPQMEIPKLSTFHLSMRLLPMLPYLAELHTTVLPSPVTLNQMSYWSSMILVPSQIAPSGFKSSTFRNWSSMPFLPFPPTIPALGLSPFLIKPSSRLACPVIELQSWVLWAALADNEEKLVWHPPFPLPLKF